MRQPARERGEIPPLGVVSIHHVSPGFFFGYDTVGEKGVRLARPEKALLDVFYLTPARSRLFCELPEIEKPDTFDPAEAEGMIARIPSSARRAMVARRFSDWMRRVR